METKGLTGAERLEIVRNVALYYGEGPQIDMMVEECAEMIHALQKYKRGRVDRAAVIEEFADIWIVLQMMGIFFDKNEIARWIDYKLTRVERVVNDLQTN